MRTHRGRLWIERPDMQYRFPSITNRFASSTLLLATAGAAGTVGTVGDPEGTRTISSIIALLVAMGLALAMLAVWLYRSTRPDPELLAPFEVMGERKWRRADPVWHRRRLDELRPDGAEPLEPSSAPPDIDEAFDLGPTAPGFDDLHDQAVDEHDDVSVPSSASRTVRDQPVAQASGDDQGAAPTPQDLERPTLDAFPDGDVDPDLIAAAMAELDAELGRSTDVAND